jgi:hypothetical protein
LAKESCSYDVMLAAKQITFWSKRALTPFLIGAAH